MIFHKILTRNQWFSLILLTAGCMVKQLNFANFFGDPAAAAATDATSMTTVAVASASPKLQLINANRKNTSGFDFSVDAIYIFIQLICSCLAGVYNEYLLKGEGARVNIYVQNVFMYVDSIVCNIALLILQGNSMDAINLANLRPVFSINVIIIILNNAAIGIVTSFFLRYLNSILKTFASALELLFTAILCYIFFHIPIHLNTILSIAIVSISIYFYTLSPVVNIPRIAVASKGHKSAPESVELLKDHDQIV